MSPIDLTYRSPFNCMYRGTRMVCRSFFTNTCTPYTFFASAAIEAVDFVLTTGFQLIKNQVRSERIKTLIKRGEFSFKILTMHYFCQLIPFIRAARGGLFFHLVGLIIDLIPENTINRSHYILTYTILNLNSNPNQFAFSNRVIQFTAHHLIGPLANLSIMSSLCDLIVAVQCLIHRKFNDTTDQKADLPHNLNKQFLMVGITTLGILGCFYFLSSLYPWIQPRFMPADLRQLTVVFGYSIMIQLFDSWMTLKYSKAYFLSLKPKQWNAIIINRWVKQDKISFDKDGDGNTLLHRAIKGHSNQTTLQLFLHLFKDDLDSVNFEGKTALHLAILQNKGDLVQMLIDQMASIQIADQNGKTPLYYALSSFLSTNRSEIVRILMPTLFLEESKSQTSIYYPNFLEKIRSRSDLEELKEKIISERDALDQIVLKTTLLANKGFCRLRLRLIDLAKKTSENKLAQISRDPHIKDLILHPAFTKNYPIFGPLIQRQLKKGGRRNVYLRAGSLLFSKSTLKPNLSSEMWEHILKHVPTQDLAKGLIKKPLFECDSLKV